MSGPITVLLAPSQAFGVLLSASAIRAAQAAQAVHAARVAAAQQHEQHRAQQEQQSRAQSAAGQAGLAAMQAQADAAEQRLAQLAELAQRLGAAEALATAQPQRPQNASYTALADYVQTLDAFTTQTRQLLATAAASQPPSDADALLHIALPHADAASAQDNAPRSQRLLQRIAHLGAPPQDITALATELDACTHSARAELLATELRLRIQLHAEAALAEQVQQAQALVIQQSLQDLGYQVEGIDSTLFVEGGTAHFRKQHWGDYMVRLRVNAGEPSINFNVVRAIDDAAGPAEVSVQDQLAEDRWCAEFPALLKTLAARGVNLQVLRRLEAGELPVQQVARSQLPQFAQDDVPRRRAATPPLARPLP